MKWMGAIIEKNIDKLILLLSLNLAMGAVVYFFNKGADDKILFWAFGLVNGFQGALFILLNVRRGAGDAPATNDTTVISSPPSASSTTAAQVVLPAGPTATGKADGQ